METRKNKRRYSVQLDPSSSSSSNEIINETKKENVNESSDYRNWNDLPESILASILELLPSIADLASAASVSHSWNSAAASTYNNDCALQYPPFILTTFLVMDPANLLDPCYARSHRCHLLPVVLGPTSKPYHRAALSFQILTHTLCVGCHLSKLILIDGTFIILYDVFSGEQIRSPQISGLRGLCLDFATLTAPLQSSSLSLVLLVARRDSYSNSTVFSWEPNGDGNRDAKYEVDMEIVSFALFKGQVYFIERKRNIGVMVFEPKVRCVLLNDVFVQNLPVFDCWGSLNQNMVECDGELLMVLFVKKSDLFLKVEVYKLDLVKKKWIKKEKLNNRCLFIDAVGNRGFSCKDPERWGGRSNCVYVHRSRCEGYSICPLNEEIENAKVGIESWLNPGLSKWLSPLWIYPNIKRVESLKSVEV